MGFCGNCCEIHPGFCKGVIRKLLEQQTHEGRTKGLAVCVTQTASPLDCPADRTVDAHALLLLYQIQKGIVNRMCPCSM